MALPSVDTVAYVRRKELVAGRELGERSPQGGLDRIARRGAGGNHNLDIRGAEMHSSNSLLPLRGGELPTTATTYIRPRQLSRGVLLYPESYQQMTPGARLKGLRGELSAREGRSVTQREVAERSKVSLSSLQKWESDAQVPHGENLLAIARFYGVLPEHILSGAPSAPVSGPTEAEGVIAPNYTDLGIDLPGYERLHDRPRGIFDRFMVELFKMGAGREALEFFGRTLLAPVMQMNMLHKGRHDADTSRDEDQMKIMDRMIPTLLEMAKEQLR